VYGGNHSTLANVLDINNASNADLRFLTNNTERMRLTSSSLYTASGISVAFGTSSPIAKLTVINTSDANKQIVQNYIDILTAYVIADAPLADLPKAPLKNDDGSYTPRS
jgi:hypothetical protein